MSSIVYIDTTYRGCGYIEPLLYTTRTSTVAQPRSYTAVHPAPNYRVVAYNA